MTFKITGYIVQKKDLLDADRLFIIFSKECGKIQVRAQGVRKISSKLGCNLEVLNLVSCTIAQGKTLDRIATVDLLESHEVLKKNLDTLTIALYLCDFVDAVVKWDLPDRELFSMLSDCFATLPRIHGIEALYNFTQVTLLKLSILLGYRSKRPALSGMLDTIAHARLNDVATLRLPAAARLACDEFLDAVLERPLASHPYFDYFMGKVGAQTALHRTAESAHTRSQKKHSTTS